MFSRILIANRGEIALRVLRACRRMGITPVVAYSEADRDTRAVQLADEAICVGPAESRRSYLSAASILSAALVTGCEAIHPGYGFLSEDDTFAEMTRAHGLTFIGPPPEVLERFASKAGTRELLGAHGLPTIPGSHGHAARRRARPRRGRAHRLPGAHQALGGRRRQGDAHGAHPARAPAGHHHLPLRGACRLRRRLAVPREVARGQPPRRGPGDRRPLRQRRPRGRARLLGPAAPPEDRGGGAQPGPRRCRAALALAEQAVAAVVAAGYENLGTLEFLVDGEGNYYFIEINCRIQVEHPVTEMLSGIDLVVEQIRIAAGEPLGYARRTSSLRGHAIEFRINAEDVAPRLPARGRRRRALPRAGRPGGAHGLATCTAATRSRRSTIRCWASWSCGARTGPPPSSGPGSRSTSWSSTASSPTSTFHRALLDSRPFLDGAFTTNLIDRVGSAAFLASPPADPAITRPAHDRPVTDPSPVAASC